MPDSLDAKVAVLQQTTSDLGRRIETLETAMSSVRDDLRTIRENQTEQLVEQRACSDAVTKLIHWTEKRDEEVRTDARVLRNASITSNKAWQAWLRQTFDARTIAIIIAIVAGFFGVSINTGEIIKHEDPPGETKDEQPGY